MFYEDMYDVPNINDYSLALYDKLVSKTKLITNNNEKQVEEGFAEINGKDVLVTYKNPEVEFRQKMLPIIVLYRHELQFAGDRATNDTLIYVHSVKEDGTPSEVIKRDYPVPFNIFYSVEYYFKREYMSAYIMEYLMKHLPRRGYLKIKDETYPLNLEQAPSLPNFGYQTFGQQESKRELREQLLYSIEGDLDLYSGDLEPLRVVEHLPEFNVEKKED